MTYKKLDIKEFDKLYNSLNRFRGYKIDYNYKDNYFEISDSYNNPLGASLDLALALQVCLKYEDVIMKTDILTGAINNVFNYKWEPKNPDAALAKIEFMRSFIVIENGLNEDEFFKAFSGLDAYTTRNILTTCLENEQASLIHLAAEQLNVKFIKLMLELRHVVGFDSQIFKLQLQSACQTMLLSDNYANIVKAQQITELLEYLNQFYFGFRHDFCVFVKQEVSKLLNIEPELKSYIDCRKFGLKALSDTQLYSYNKQAQKNINLTIDDIPVAIAVVEQNDRLLSNHGSLPLTRAIRSFMCI